MHPHRYRIFIGGGLSTALCEADSRSPLTTRTRRSSPILIRPPCTGRWFGSRHLISTSLSSHEHQKTQADRRPRARACLMSMSWTIPVTGRGSAGTSGQESVVIARFDSYRRAEHMLAWLGRGSAGRPAGAPCHGWSDSWACSPWRKAQGAGSALSRCVAGTSGRRSTGPTRSWPELARMRPWCWLPARTRRRIRWSPRPRPTASARPAQVLLEYQGACGVTA